MRRRIRKILVEDTPLSIFVRERLAELGMKQSEFCRLTGFDQGLLSKVQSSMATNLSLESALRLSIGLCVPPAEILRLIDRPDLDELVKKAYAWDSDGKPAVYAGEIPPQVREVTDLAMRAHNMGRNLLPVIRILCPLAILPREAPRGHATGKTS